tara:strand:- start:12066 stop:12497 length:432 start_codon:yes stop_codon:yes gene_type:complete
MAMSIQDLLASISGGQGMSPISQGFSPATRMPQGRGRRRDARLGTAPMNPIPRLPREAQPMPLPSRPGSGPTPATPMPSNPNETPTMVPLGGGIQSRSFRMDPNMQAIIEAAAQGRQRGNAPQARAQRFMRSDPSQMLGMVQR